MPTPRKTARGSSAAAKAAARNTDSGPANPMAASDGDFAARKMAETGEMAAAMPANPNKAAEHGAANGQNPPVGATVAPPSRLPASSTLTEVNVSPKTGEAPAEGNNPTNGPLTRVRVDSSGRHLTTNQGVAIADNQNSLKAGTRGPVLLEDFILRDKLTHFDHERIPERIVHARGSAAHGFFEAYDAIPHLTKAAPFQQAGKITPVFVRFSTVQGERGSKDTARDVRGFAVKFYTDEGNWDLVGNNIPVFFIQDAMKFPDLVHAVKPEPHHQMPQAASAHDTFWDFVSLMPESTHMLMWVMSDRAIPRSYATMQGFGVHTFRLVNEAGESSFVKFHWTPKYGTHSLVWDEAVKISGADPDYHRRDLWERIEAGAFPEYELGLQVFTEEQADKFSFDILDATKIIPEELVPIQPVGRMVLNRNPDNFFAETEQVAFCTANIIPGLDFTNDPLLAGRIHSYVDTQISRLGGANFHEIPINAPIAPVHNNQRDGMHRQAINRGRVAYEPNSLAGGCPFQAGAAQGFTSVAARLKAREDQAKVRAKPELFAEHYNQAALFFNSQTPAEQAHIAAAFRFELSKVTVPAIRQRVVAMLRNASETLAAQVAAGLNMNPLPEPMPRALTRKLKPEVTNSPPLSLMARPGDGSVKGRKVAIFVADGCAGQSAADVHAALLNAGAVPRFVAPRIGPVATVDGVVIEADASLENEPAFLFDALVLPDGDAAVIALSADGHSMEGIRDQYRHCKTILALGTGADLLDLVGLPRTLPNGEPDPGLTITADASTGAAALIGGLARHRHPERETDPPVV
ncbi:MULTISPECIES: catalase [unclassified Roseateles]|uniref:catalase n=1 Tax=unclassified Roseateles TaxID=2626991 RepID=UPI0006F4F8A5|nr:MULTISPECIES: catalase [unclassified Roseateles]KQW43242.1 catalase [Pelomonas sp. Root405]KRA70980.1 catalase [Pelomonas sp. Root662]